MKESSGYPSSNSHRECSGTTCMDDLSHKTLKKTPSFHCCFLHVDTSLLNVDPFSHEGPTSRIVFVVVGYDRNLPYQGSALAQLYPIHLYLYVRSYLCEKQVGQKPFCRVLWCL